MRWSKDGITTVSYTSEERQKALEVSLTALASSLGYTPERVGSRFRLREMDSLMIYNDRTWNRWSGKGNRTGGTQIDFLLEFGNVSTVPEAVDYLLQFKGEPMQEVKLMLNEKRDKPHNLQMPEKNSNYRRLYAYLIQTRGLSQMVVSDFVQRKLIYEDAVHHNIVYCGYDPEGKIRYAGLRGTADQYGKKFKMDLPGNDKNYGVNIVNCQSNELKVFEAVIDCMSYIDLTGDVSSNKLVLGMVEDNPLQQFLKDYSHIHKITFCLDNDEAGHKAIYGAENRCGLKQKYEECGYSVDVEFPQHGKDFNECLQIKKNVAEASTKNEDPANQTDEMVHRAVRRR